jgi:bifunctional non-homologous end joining protein LigD
LIWCYGHDVTGKTVVQRREQLEEIITPVPGIQIGGYVERRGKDLFQLAKEKGLEGIIAKRKPSTYRPEKRSPDWLKIEARPQQEIQRMRGFLKRHAPDTYQRVFYDE